MKIGFIDEFNHYKICECKSRINNCPKEKCIVVYGELPDGKNHLLTIPHDKIRWISGE